MRKRMRRFGLTVASVATGGYLAATGGCLSFAGERLFEMVDFCFVIDCTGGVSGLLQPCFSEGMREDILFTDCPTQTQGP